MERLMVVPLRKARRGSKERFAPKAMRYLKDFVKRHMKAQEVVVGEELNKFIWSQGVHNPPRRVQVKSVKKEGKAYVEIATVSQEKWKSFTGEKEKPKKEKKKPETKEKKVTKKKPEKRAEKKVKKSKPAKTKKTEKKTKAKKVTKKKAEKKKSEKKPAKKAKKK